MIVRSLEVFCVGCGQVIERDAAAQVFRTGFYRHTLPLGLCVACEQVGMVGPLAPAELSNGVAQPDSNEGKPAVSKILGGSR